MSELGEKDQGCQMLDGIKKQYPKAKQSVIQKAKYEKKNTSAQALDKNLENIFPHFKNFLDKNLKEKKICYWGIWWTR